MVSGVYDSARAFSLDCRASNVGEYPTGQLQRYLVLVQSDKGIQFELRLVAIEALSG